MNGMDRKIEKKNRLNAKTLWIVAGTIFILLVSYNILFGDKSSKLNVEEDKLTIDKVKNDNFQDYIAVIGTVEPIKTIYLDAVEGGRVEQILKDEGAILKKGDAILTLSNTNLILEISGNEAQVSRAINDLRTARLGMIQQQLSLERQVIDLKRDFFKEERAYHNNQNLYADELISKEDYLQSKELYESTKHALALLKEAKKTDSVFRATQLSTLESSVNRMEKNLDIIRTKLDNLNITAPVDGQLATLNIEIGKVVTYGTRIGTINMLNGYKLRVEIDEYFSHRIRDGLKGSAEFAGSYYPVKIVKIYPEVENGRFAADMQFVDSVPDQIKFKQTSRIKLELGESKNAILLSRGGFYQSTGGQWVYVVDPSGDFATKRKIRIGRQNPSYYEVLIGLKPGEKVIVSSYDNFGDADKLILKK